mmetsp:Transcript_17460/g.41090  ORF Transcript_17460/g.41090 Transcript_17460/m.41090 type:complete len:266 (-) Transcript_17460:310-1107(-)
MLIQLIHKPREKLVRVLVLSDVDGVAVQVFESAPEATGDVVLLLRLLQEAHAALELVEHLSKLCCFGVGWINVDSRHCHDGAAKLWTHEQVLKHRVHVARGAGILQPHVVAALAGLLVGAVVPIADLAAVAVVGSVEIRKNDPEVWDAAPAQLDHKPEGCAATDACSADRTRHGSCSPRRLRLDQQRRRGKQQPPQGERHQGGCLGVRLVPARSGVRQEHADEAQVAGERFLRLHVGAGVCVVAEEVQEVVDLKHNQLPNLLLVL